jgi:cytochrome c oxidase subunit 2
MKWTKWVMVCSIVFISVMTTGDADAARKNTDPQIVEIRAKKFAYIPSEVTLVKGVTYRFHLTSDDVPHSLRIKALNMNWEMKAGEFDDVLFTPGQTGNFAADCGHYCGSGHKAMSMVVRVVNK